MRGRWKTHDFDAFVWEKTKIKAGMPVEKSVHPSHDILDGFVGHFSTQLLHN